MFRVTWKIETEKNTVKNRTKIANTNHQIKSLGDEDQEGVTCTDEFLKTHMQRPDRHP